MRLSSLLGCTSLLVASVAAVACGSASVTTSELSDQGGSSGADGSEGGAAGSSAGNAGSGNGGSAGSGGSSGTAGTGGSAGTGIEIDPDAGTPPQKTIIYAHTDTTLYKIDPELGSANMELIGDFDCVNPKDGNTSMTDLAVDKAGNVWGVSATAVYPLTIDEDQGAVHCGKAILFSSNSRFYGLTFAPAGVLDPAKEVLIAGNTAGELWSIDEKGVTTLRGNFGDAPANDGHGHAFKYPNKRFALSGDIVFLANDGVPVGFATVRDCKDNTNASTCSTVNTLIEIDVKKMATASSGSVRKSIRGQLFQQKGCNDGITDGNYGNMYGVAAWNDKVYGFSRSGNVATISIDDGTACLVKNYPSAKFAGAGVTTIAPVSPPIN